MSSTVIVQSVGIEVSEVTAIAVLFVLVSGGLVGMSIRNMFESIMSEDDEGEDGEEDLGGGGLGGDDGGLMTDDGGDDDLGGLGGLDEGGDDLGGFDDDEDFGEMESDEGGNVDELEHRLDELENEVGSLSSTVNTVRNENEQIAESMDEVEENVRKLLDIYEMVTRGVNPFADDIDAGMGGGMGEGGSDFGLFGDEEDDSSEDEVDAEIAEADAEGFFDDDIVDEEESMDADAGFDDVLDDGGSNEEPSGDAFQESFDEGFDEGGDLGGVDDFGDIEDNSTDDGGDSGGKSFEDLKTEYESGDADWAEEDDHDAASGGPEPAEPAGTEDPETGMGEELADDELFDEVIDEEATETETSQDPEREEGVQESDNPFETTDFESAGETTEEPRPEEPPEESDGQTEAEAVAEQAEPATQPGAEKEHTESTDETEQAAAEASEGSTAAGNEPSETPADEGKPYLAVLPDGFASELIVVEWLEFLVEETGVRGTARALDYYESIDWIDETVQSELREYLKGFEGSADNSLTIDHHTQSLQFISQLNGDSAGLAGIPGGGSDGIQR